MKKIITLSIAMLLCASMVYAQKTMPRFEIPTTRANGMGGSHIAYTDNVYSLLVNPAAMMRTQQRSLFALSGTLFNPEMTFDLVEPILGMTSLDEDTLKPLGDMANTLSKQNGKIGMGFDIRGLPLSIAWVANGFGIGAWSRVFVNPNIIGTTIDVNVIGDVIVPVGFAFKVLDMEGHVVDLGLTLKTYGRAMLKESMNIMSMMDGEDPFKDNNISVPLIMGFGLDMGFLYRGSGLLNGFSAGITFTDIINHGTLAADFGNTTGDLPNTTYTVPFALNLGAAYEMKINSLLGLVVAADWRDVFSDPNDYQKRNPALNLGLGAQLSLLSMFKFRVGISDALPSIGIGVDLGVFEISLAYYGKELGLDPGINPVAALDLTIAFHPEAKKRVWPWAQRSIVGMFTGGN